MKLVGDTMIGRLERKVCLVTGSGGAIGRAIAMTFAREGALVVGCDFNAEWGQETIEVLAREGLQMNSFHPCDLTNPNQCQEFIKFAVQRHGKIDVLVNNAGKAYFKWMDDITDDDWERTISHELDIVYLVTKAAWQELAKARGTIVNMASTAGHISFKALGGLAHCAAKGGVIAMTRQLAMEGRKHGIRANSISPGTIETPSTRRLLQDPAWAEAMLGKIMRGKLGQPQEIAAVALFLASDESSFVNAADIVADGGTTAW
jgi:NAD(P)-dependent dehydrogenase (short-subunit alcohol dehydrogenase family)